MLKNYFKKVIGQIKKPFNLFIENLDGGSENLSKRCLIYFKTDPFYRDLKSLKLSHTNNEEILMMADVLNQLGYIVDVVDRSSNNFKPKDKYDLFIGNASGNSGKRYYEIASKLNKSKKIIYCTGPEPTLSNSLVKERYDSFNKKNKTKTRYKRTTDIPFEKFLNISDSIFSFGEKNQFCGQSYKEKSRLPIYNILPSVDENLYFENSWLKSRKLSKFLCFAGSGAICKGVDILIEAFEHFPELELHVCSPNDDDIQALRSIYRKRFKSNIFYHGFVKPGSKKFNSLVSKCSFSILNSAAEGCCTSLITTMTCGLVPIMNYECGINIFDDRIKIISKEDKLQSTINTLKKILLLDKDSYENLVEKTLQESKKYGKHKYTSSLKSALINFEQNHM